jgi:hypothetical protein
LTETVSSESLEDAAENGTANVSGSAETS